MLPLILTNLQIFLERFAYFAFRALVVLVMFSSVSSDGFGFYDLQMRIILSVMMSILPIGVAVLTGRLCDGIGQTRATYIALSFNMLAYVLFVVNRMSSDNPHFMLLMVTTVLLGIGSGLFFSASYGKIAQCLKPKTAGISLAFTIFAVNIASAAAPIATSSFGSDGLSLIGCGFAMLATLVNFCLTAANKKCHRPVKPVHPQEPSISPEDLEENEAVCVIPKKLPTQEVATPKRPQLATLILFIVILAIYNIDDGLRDSMGAVIGNVSGVDNITQLSIGISLAAMLLIVPIAWVASHFKRKTALVAAMCLTCFGGLLASLSSIGELGIVGGVAGLFIALCGGNLYTVKLYEYFAINAPDDRKSTYMGLARLPGLFGVFLPFFVLQGTSLSCTVSFGIGLISIVIMALFLRKSVLNLDDFKV